MARLLATLATLALVIASAVGSYAHAVGHDHHHQALEAQHSGHQHSSHQHSPAQGEAAQAAAEVDASHKPAGTGHSHADCCDTICHGGYAILSLAGDVSPALAPAPFTALVTQGGGTRPGSLDRPPRAPVLA